MKPPNESIRVLHVDDEPDFADMAATFLEREDDRFDIETTTSASEGLDRLASDDFDCVVSDYDMPGQNGIEFLEAVREEYEGLPFILYTGKGSEEVASEAISAGVTDYLQKEGGTDQYKILANRISNAVESYRSQQQLAERNRDLRQYKYMINSMHEAACIYDEDGRFVLVNEYLATWYDTTREALEGQQSNLIPSIREQAEDGDPYQALLDGERDQLSGEVEYDFPDHGSAVVAYRLTPLMVDGTVEGVVGVARDVTDQKEREQELYRTKRAMDEAPVGITITDPDREDNPVIYANERFQELTGYSEPEILGRNCRFLQGEATDPNPVTRMREAIDNEERVSVELRNYRKDGTEFWNEVSIAPVRDDDGSVINYVGFQKDISDQRRRQRVLREMYDIISNRHQSFEDQVQALLELGRTELNTEYGTLSEIRGDEYVFEFVATDDESIQSGDIVPVSATNCELVVSSEETLVIGDIERDAPEQTDRAGFTEWGISCYLGAPVFTGDEVYGTFCFYGTESRSDQFSEWEVTLVDLMSRWVSYELQRREATEQLQQTNERLEEFASVVSHDLRNPLNVAEGRLELANEECDSEHLDDVENALERSQALIDDLLTLAREGNRVDDIDAVDLGTLTESCWHNVATGEATISVDIDQTIRADQSRLQQLLENLYRNAIEHGGDDVAVTVGALSDGFYIEDDGPGIPADEREDVFDAGYSTSEDGTGFGLSIVQQIVDAHGWEIRVTDGSDGGARFEITGAEFSAE